MATILPHTTRATGTVLTALIYNTDHQVHVTNANALNNELAGVSDINAVNGIVVSNGAGVISGRSLEGVADQIVVNNADGTAGNPSIGLVANPIINGMQISIVSTDAGAGGGPNLRLIRRSPSPAPGDAIGTLQFRGMNNIGAEFSYANIIVGIDDATDGTMDANVVHNIILNGSLAPRLTLNAAGVTIGGALSIPSLTTGAISGTTGTFSGPLSSTNATFTGTLNVAGLSTLGITRGGDGSAVTPAYSFTSDPNTGIYNTPDQVNFTTAGAFRANITNTFLNVGREDANSSVKGASLGFNGQCIFTVVSDVVQILNRTSADGVIVQFRNDNITVGTIEVIGAATNYNTSSDARLKEAFHEFNSGDIIDRLTFGRFNWKGDGAVGYGVLAQDVLAVFPEAISENDGYYMADYSKFVPVLGAELKALRRRVAELEMR